MTKTNAILSSAQMDLPANPAPASDVEVAGHNLPNSRPEAIRWRHVEVDFGDLLGVQGFVGLRGVEGLREFCAVFAGRGALGGGNGVLGSHDEQGYAAKIADPPLSHPHPETAVNPSPRKKPKAPLMGGPCRSEVHLFRVLGPLALDV